MRRFLLSLTIISVFVACDNVYENDQLVTNQLENDNVATRTIALTPLEQDVATMLELGLDTTNMLIRDDYYMVKGICVPKSVLEEARNTPNLQGRISQNQPINQHYRKIHYKLPYDSGTMWTNTMAAIEQWNSIQDCGLVIDASIHERIDMSYFQIEWVVSNYYFETDPLVFPIYKADYTQPYDQIIINISNPLWNTIWVNNMGMSLFMHAIGESLRFESVDYYNGADPSIMMSEDLLEQYPNLWGGFTANDLIGIRSAFPEQEEPQFVYTWSPNVEALPSEGTYILKEGVNYTLTITSNTHCCLSSSGVLFGIDIRKKNSSSTNGITQTRLSGENNKFTVCIDNEGEYELTAWVNDGVTGNLHEQTIDLLLGEDEFVYIEPDSTRLRVPYTIRYNHITHPSRTVEYSISELMFDNGTGASATLSQSGDECTVTLRKYGCYVLNAIIRDNDQVIDTVYFNMTKLMEFPGRANAYIQCDAINYRYQDAIITDVDTLAASSYYLSMGLTWRQDRFACYVQSKMINAIDDSTNNTLLDIENGYIIPSMTYDYYLLQIRERPYDRAGDGPHLATNNRPLPTLYTLKIIDPVFLTSETWRECYTGRICIPTDGIREVGGMSIYDQPIEYFDVPIRNYLLF